MLKMTPIKLMNPELFEKKITEIYDATFTQRYWYVHCKNSTEFDEILTQIIPGYKEMVEADNEESDDGECVDLTINNRLVIVFWFNADSINCIMHECLHAVLFCAKGRGVEFEKDHEALCYMYGFLVSELLDRLKLTLKRTK